MRKALSFALALLLAFALSLSLACKDDPGPIDDGTEAATLESVDVTGFKDSYTVNETLSLTGAVLTAYYTDGASKEVPLTADMVTGFDTSKAAAINVQIAYTEGDVTRSTSVAVTVYAENEEPGEAVLLSLEASGLETELYVGDNLELRRAVLSATYSDGSAKEIPIKTEMLEGLDGLTDTAGEKTLRVRYDGLADEVKIVVADRTADETPASMFTHADVTYTDDAGETQTGVKITKFTAGEGFDGNLVIPASIDGKPVVELAKNAFANNTDIVTADIPDSVRTLGTSVFAMNKAAEPVKLKAVRFSGTSRIKTIPGHFLRETAVEELFLPEGVTELLANAINNEPNLREVYLPSTLKKLGNRAFRTCRAIEILKFAEGTVLEGTMVDGTMSNPMGERVFDDMNALKELSVPEGITQFSKDLFYNLDSLTTLRLPASLTTLEPVSGSAFSRIKNVRLIQLAEGSKVTEIPDSCFENKKKLSGVDFGGAQLTRIGSSAFVYDSALSSLSIPDTVTEIGGDAFYLCSSLRTAALPESLTEIGDGAFADTDLRMAHIPAGVTELKRALFLRCDNLERVTFAAKSELKTVGPDVFSYTGIKTISLPATLERVDASAFSNCDLLTTVDFGENSKLAELGENAFRNCKVLDEIRNAQSIAKVGNSAFYGCKSLRNTDFLGAVTEIGAWAFYNSGLTSASFGEGLVVIGERAFAECVSLASVTLPATLATISTGAFDENLHLTEVVLPADNNVAYIGDYAFYGCDLRVFPALPKVQSVGNYSFYANARLTEVSLPATLAEMGDGVFYDCAGLEKISFLSSPIIYQSAEMFTGCEKLESIFVTGGALDEMRAAFPGVAGKVKITEGVEIDKISVASFPGQQLKGGNLDLTNAKLLVAYTDDTSRLVPVSEEMVTGFVSSAEGDVTLTITFDGREVQTVVQILNAYYTLGGSFDGRALYGQDFDVAGVKLMYYEEGEQPRAVADLTPEMIRTYAPDEVGMTTITILYQEKTVEVPVQILGVKTMQVTGLRNEHQRYTELDLTDARLQVVYTDRSTASVEITHDMISGFDSSEIINSASATITYLDKSVQRTDLSVVDEYLTFDEIAGGIGYQIGASHGASGRSYVYVPATYRDQPVLAIGRSAFDDIGFSGILSFSKSSVCERIDGIAFYGSKISMINIPASLKTFAIADVGGARGIYNAASGNVTLVFAYSTEVVRFVLDEGLTLGEGQYPLDVDPGNPGGNINPSIYVPDELYDEWCADPQWAIYAKDGCIHKLSTYVS